MRRLALIPLLFLPFVVACSTTEEVKSPFAQPNQLMAKEIRNRIAEIPFQHREELFHNMLWLAQAGEQVIPDLLVALGHPEPKVRASVCWILGRIRDRRVIPNLQPVTEDESEVVQLEAARTLLLLGAMDHAPSLIEALDSEQVQVRYLCHEALKFATGRDFGYDHLSENVTNRRGTVLDWRKWWSAMSGDASFSRSYADLHGLGAPADPVDPGETPAAPLDETGTAAGSETEQAAPDKALTEEVPTEKALTEKALTEKALTEQGLPDPVVTGEQPAIEAPPALTIDPKTQPGAETKTQPGAGTEAKTGSEAPAQAGNKEQSETGAMSETKAPTTTSPSTLGTSEWETPPPPAIESIPPATGSGALGEGAEKKGPPSEGSAPVTIEELFGKPRLPSTPPDPAKAGEGNEARPGTETPAKPVPAIPVPDPWGQPLDEEGPPIPKHLKPVQIVPVPKGSGQPQPGPATPPLGEPEKQSKPEAKGDPGTAGEAETSTPTLSELFGSKVTPPGTGAEKTTVETTGENTGQKTGEKPGEKAEEKTGTTTGQQTEEKTGKK